jgi:hypothetical protein
VSHWHPASRDILIILILQIHRHWIAVHFLGARFKYVVILLYNML